MKKSDFQKTTFQVIFGTHFQLATEVTSHSLSPVARRNFAKLPPLTTGTEAEVLSPNAPELSVIYGKLHPKSPVDFAAYKMRREQSHLM